MKRSEVTSSTRYARFAPRWVVVLAASVLALTGVSAAPAAALPNASIAGTVTGPGGPVAGVLVNAMVPGQPGGGGAETGPGGTYQIVGLAAGSYVVEFQGGSLGLATQYYDGAASWDDATPVPVTAGADRPNIDAALVAGGSISGTVTGPGGPVEGVWVYAIVPGGPGG